MLYTSLLAAVFLHPISIYFEIVIAHLVSNRNAIKKAKHNKPIKLFYFKWSMCIECLISTLFIFMRRFDSYGMYSYVYLLIFFFKFLPVLKLVGLKYIVLYLVTAHFFYKLYNILIPSLFQCGSKAKLGPLHSLCLSSLLPRAPEKSDICMSWKATKGE